MFTVNVANVSGKILTSTLTVNNVLLEDEKEEFVEHRYTQLRKASGETFSNISDTWSFISIFFIFITTQQ